MNNFYISYPGRLGNQLFLLYHIYNICDKIDKIYAPFFESSLSYFKGEEKDVFCNEDFFESNKESFIEVGWEDQKVDSIENIYDSKFDDLKLKEIYTYAISNIINTFENKSLVAVHIRQGDYIDFCNGDLFFSINKYLEETQKNIKEWGLVNYKILLFSDILLPKDLEGFIVSDITNNEAPIDLFLMGQCNYFIHTWSTFSLLAIKFSKSLEKFKNNKVLEKEKINE
jgi:hypothetical protein